LLSSIGFFAPVYPAHDLRRSGGEKVPMKFF